MNLFVAFIGCLAGFVVCSKVGVCAVVLVTERRAAIAASQSRLPVYAAVALHSGPWLALGAVVFLVLFARTESPPPWAHTIFLGFCAGICLYVVVLCSALLRIRARKRSQA